MAVTKGHAGIVRVAFFTALLIIFSKISLSLPFTPVPITLQTLAVFIIGLMLKPFHAFLAVAIYLAAGALGLPVFAKGGGLSYILGPTGGFLMGFLVSAPLVSYLKERSKSVVFVAAGLLLGLLIIYLLGAVYLSFVTKKGFLATLYAAVFPFVPFDIVKASVALAAYKVYFSGSRDL